MRSVQVRLEDISDAITGIEATLLGVDLEGFSRSWPIQRAVERGLEIISEASRGIPEEQRSTHPEVPWPQIAGIGNILRHEYHRVEPTIVWNITQTHLPVLARAVRQMLMGADTDEG
jgi:uncharacterized protein with HEPN domain